MPFTQEDTGARREEDAFPRSHNLYGWSLGLNLWLRTPSPMFFVLYWWLPTLGPWLLEVLEGSHKGLI